MALPQLIRHWLGADRIAELAERVAGRSRMAVWQRVKDQLPELGPTEIRGYIRARAVTIVVGETRRLIEQDGAKIARHRDRIAAAAIDLLIETIVQQVGQKRTAVAIRHAA